MKIYRPSLFIFLLNSLIVISIFMAGCATVPNDKRIDNNPMYGQPEIERPEFLKKADKDFIKKASKGFGGSRKEASKAWASVADDFLRKGDLHYAMRRYNQSWLLDPNNYHPYYGFGQIMIMRGEIDAAIKYMEKAKALINDPYQKPAVLSDTAIVYSYKAQSIMTNLEERAKYFGIANQLFKESSQLDKTYTEVWRRWAYSLFEEGNYSETWEKVKKAHSVGADPLPPKFLEALKEKMPEPKYKLSQNKSRHNNQNMQYNQDGINK